MNKTKSVGYSFRSGAHTQVEKYTPAYVSGFVLPYFFHSSASISSCSFRTLRPASTSAIACFNRAILASLKDGSATISKGIFCSCVTFAANIVNAEVIVSPIFLQVFSILLFKAASIRKFTIACAMSIAFLPSLSYHECKAKSIKRFHLLYVLTLRRTVHRAECCS